jgi:hypothetical protein
MPTQSTATCENQIAVSQNHLRKRVGIYGERANHLRKRVGLKERLHE